MNKFIGSASKVSGSLMTVTCKFVISINVSGLFLKVIERTTGNASKLLIINVIRQMFFDITDCVI